MNQNQPADPSVSPPIIGGDLPLTQAQWDAIELVNLCFHHSSPEAVRFLRYMVEVVCKMPWLEDLPVGFKWREPVEAPATSQAGHDRPNPQQSS